MDQLDQHLLVGEQGGALFRVPLAFLVSKGSAALSIQMLTELHKKQDEAHSLLEETREIVAAPHCPRRGPPEA